jgi:hypothetical protein
MAHCDAGGEAVHRISNGSKGQPRNWSAIRGKADSNYTAHLDLILAHANLSATAALIPLNATCITEPKGCFDNLVIMKSQPTKPPVKESKVVHLLIPTEIRQARQYTPFCHLTG